MELLEGQEGRNVDFKLDPRAVEAEDIVAFANAGGGTILAGVAEETGANGMQRGRIEGCDVSDGMRQTIMGKASSCRPSVDIQVLIENAATDRPILRIDIPEGQTKPYCTASGTYKTRSEGRNVAIDPPLMKAIILKSEVDEFVERFKHAGNELLEELKRVETDLAAQLRTVQQAAETASESAHRAESAAHEATQAAMEAATAAEHSGT
jgi:predicted HTH transcriptional regulator